MVEPCIKDELELVELWMEDGDELIAVCTIEDSKLLELCVELEDGVEFCKLKDEVEL